MALLSSSPVIEASKLVTIEVESCSRTPRGAGINVASRFRLCTHTHYIDDLYHIMHHDNYEATGDVVKFSLQQHIQVYMVS